MFKHCNNWNHAADILISRLTQYYVDNNSNWSEVLFTLRNFSNEIKSNPRILATVTNANSLEVLSDMMSIFEQVNKSRMV